MLPKIFKPQYEYNFLRIGGKFDGGYIVEKDTFFNSELLISAGLSYDFEFEKQFMIQNNKKVICFDHTLNFKHYSLTWFLIFLKRIILLKKAGSIKKAFKNFLKPIRLFFFLKNENVELKELGLGLGPKKISLKKLFEKYVDKKNILLKIDIEGDEYRLLDEIIYLSEKISSLVIEFHDIDLNLEKVEKFISNLKLDLVHIHPNNVGGINSEGDPTIIEFTFANSPQRISERKNVKNELDTDTNPSLGSIDMKFKN